MYEIGEHVEISVCRNDANFDRASDTAYNIACSKFGLDEDGYCKNIKGWERSTDMIIVEFANYRRVDGQEHQYIFTGWIESNNE